MTTSTQQAHPARASWRTAAQTVLSVILVVGVVAPIIAGILSEELGEHLPEAWLAWIAGAAALIAAASAALARIMAIPAVDAWLRHLGLSSTPRHAQVAPDGAHVITTLAGSTPPPSVGRVVRYTSRNGDGVTSPAIVLRTRAATVPGVIDRWGTNPDGTLSGTGRPAGLVPELPDELTVDLLVHGLGGDYREFAVPYAPTSEPGAWSWPPRT